MIVAGIAAALAAAGLAPAIVGTVLVGRFAAAAQDVGPDASRAKPSPVLPPITILKPLHGDEPLLEHALGSLCAQDYPAFQIVFGVHDAADTALTTVRGLRASFPKTDIAVVVNPARHGANGKVSNLINMLPAAKHDVLAIADSDLHVRPDYLARLAEALAAPGTGLVTTLYAGLPATRRLAARLGAMQITQYFLPGALVARAMGRQDCLGATMLLRRPTLERIGGFRALVDHLADDQVLGRRVQALGLAVRLAHTVTATTVPEASLSALWRHELRWSRTVRALVPAMFAASVLQYPLFWAALAVPLAGGAAWAWGMFCIAWVVRSVAALGVDRALEPMLRGLAAAAGPSAVPAFPVTPAHAARTPPPRYGDGSTGGGDESVLGLAFACPVWLLPLRDLISVVVMLASYGGRRVEWRGHTMTADTPVPVTAKEPHLR